MGRLTTLAAVRTDSIQFQSFPLSVRTPTIGYLRLWAKRWRTRKHFLVSQRSLAPQTSLCEHAISSASIIYLNRFFPIDTLIAHSFGGECRLHVLIQWPAADLPQARSTVLRESVYPPKSGTQFAHRIRNKCRSNFRIADQPGAK